jgi:tRNA(Arg) A34 adenosine deaminase TadA
MSYKPKKKFMNLAIKEARDGNKKYGKYPIGAIVVKDNKVISKSPNGLPDNVDPTAHAEVLSIRKAAKKLKSRYLNDCVLYTTNEPCAMCSGAAVWANMKGVVYGANVRDLEKFWKKRRTSKSERKFIFVPISKSIKGVKPKLFIKGNFVRKECLKLFELYD